MDYLWNSTILSEETVVFVKDAPDAAPRARLLFAPEEILYLTNTDASTEWDPQTDVFVDANDPTTLLLAAESTIPSLTLDELYVPAYEGDRAFLNHRDGEHGMLFSEQDLWPNLQPRITYRHAGWDLPRPQGQADRLPRTHEKLQGEAPFSFVLFGDSISVGANATAHIKVPPYRPCYGQQVADALAAAACAPVQYENHSRGGQTSAWGVENIQPVLDAKPDLVVLAWGMNDASGLMPVDAFINNIKTQMETIRAVSPECEFVLVAGMCGNPEWRCSAPQTYPLYRDALLALATDGVAVADLTTLWMEMLKRKRFADITGNGVNHPNDFGQNLYAQVVTYTILSD